MYKKGRFKIVQTGKKINVFEYKTRGGAVNKFHSLMLMNMRVEFIEIMEDGTEYIRYSHNGERPQYSNSEI